MTPGEHREKALALLERAADLPQAPAMRAISAAQVHATLSLAVPPAPVSNTRRKPATKKTTAPAKETDQ